MSIFEDVTLTWKGEEYTVPANDVMRLIAKVENEISLIELGREQGPPLAKLAMAYAVALTHAGAKVKADEVYAALFTGDAAEAAANAAVGIQMLMMPPETYKPQVSKAKKKDKGGKAEQ